MHPSKYAIFLLATCALAACSDSNPTDPDLCPDDPDKIIPGICGCGTPDTDSDGDGIPDCLAQKLDLCPDDTDKTLPGACGCGTPDTDADNNTIPDCLDDALDLCPDDTDKTLPGACGCGTPDTDTDGDTIPDCLDPCPSDPDKITPSICGCGTPDSPENLTDSDGDGVIDCLDACPQNPYVQTVTENLACDDTDTDHDGIADKNDDCPYNPNIASLQDGQDCNIESDGNTDVFKIYSAHDFTRLREFLKKRGDQLEYQICLTPDETVCDETPRICKPDTLSNGMISFYQAAACQECRADETTGKDTCVPPPFTIGAPCGENPTTPTCADMKNTVICQNGAYQATPCKAEEYCKNGACTPLDSTIQKCGEDLTVDNDESCAPSQKMRSYCLDGIIQTMPCDCLNASRLTFCKFAPETKNSPLRIELQNDINLADILPTQTIYGNTCVGNWQSINLDNLTFDGKRHAISFEKNGHACALNQPLFSTIHRSNIKDLNLHYDIAGLANAAIAMIIAKSEFQSVSWTGNAHIGTAALDEKSQISKSTSSTPYDFTFSPFAFAVFDSVISNAAIQSGSIKISPFTTFESHASAGVFYAMENTLIESGSFQISQYACTGTCAMLAHSAVHSTLKNTVATYGDIVSHGKFTGLFNDISKKTALDNDNFEIGSVYLDSQNDAPPQNLLFGKGDSEWIENIQLKIGKILKTAENALQLTDTQNGSWDGFSLSIDSLTTYAFQTFKHINGNIQNLSIDIKDAQTSKFNAIAMGIESGADIQNADIAVENLKATEFQIVQTINGTISSASFAFPRMITNAADFFVDLTSTARISNAAFYGNIYINNTSEEVKTAPIIGTLNTNNPVFNILSGMRSYSFTQYGDDGNPAEPQPTAFPRLVSEFGTATPQITNAFWLKFHDAETACKNAEFEPLFTPFTNSQAPEILKAINEKNGSDTWELKTFKANGLETTIPWPKR